MSILPTTENEQIGSIIGTGIGTTLGLPFGGGFIGSKIGGLFGGGVARESIAFSINPDYSVSNVASKGVPLSDVQQAGQYLASYLQESGIQITDPKGFGIRSNVGSKDTNTRIGFHPSNPNSTGKPETISNIGFDIEAIVKKLLDTGVGVLNNNVTPSQTDLQDSMEDPVVINTGQNGTGGGADRLSILNYPVEAKMPLLLLAGLAYILYKKG